MKDSKLIWIAVIIILIIAGGFYAWSKNLIPGLNGRGGSATDLLSPTAQQKNQSQVSNTSTAADSGAENEADTSLIEDEADSPAGKRSDEKPDETLRQQIIAYVNQNLNKLAAPPAKDKWDIPTFYFVGNSNVYVELYGEETDLTGVKILYKAEKDSRNAIKLTELAKYKEGENDWVITSGQDNLDNYVMEEYDLNEDNNKWEKTDEFTDESYLDEDANLSEDTGSGQILP